MRLRIRLIYGAITSVVLVLLGAAFIYACYSIYEQGGSPFTRESIGKALTSLLIPISAAIALVVGGFVLSLCLPTEEPRLVGKPDRQIIADKLSEKRDVTALDLTEQKALGRTRVAKKALRVSTIVVTLISLALAFVYALNFENYNDELNDSVIRCTIAVIVSLSPSILLWAVRLIVEPWLTEKEIKLLTSAPKAECAIAPNERKITAFFRRNEKELILASQIAFVSIAVLYITLGIFNGGMNDVLQKAIKICTECIGLG